MIWRTHRIAWLAFPLVYWALTWTFEEMWIIVFIMAPFLWQLPDYDMNEKNTWVIEVIDAFKRQWIIEQSLRIFFKKISWWEHRWLTHSLFFTFVFFLLSTIVLLFWWTIHTVIWLTLALASHQVLDMFNNTWVRLFWPHPWKINVLNFIPNLLKFWRWQQYTAKWFNLHWFFKLVWMIVSILAMFFTFKYLWQSSTMFSTVLLIWVLLVEFYILVKFIFVITWSKEEEIIVYWPLMITSWLITIVNYDKIVPLFINWWIWLSNHWFILLLTFVFLIFKWFNVFWNKFKYLFKTSKISLTMLMITAMISLAYPDNFINSISRTSVEWIKEK